MVSTIELKSIPANSIRKSLLVQGRIALSGSLLTGWISCAFSAIKPAVFIDDIPAEAITWDIPCPKVEKNLGINAKEFTFHVSGAKKDSIVSLYGVTSDSIFLIEQKPLSMPVWESNFFCQAQKAARISKNPDSVGIVCWDGVLDPIARAKELYDIVNSRSQAVIFTYLHEEFGNNLWPPLHNSDLPIVAIPWKKRHLCYQIMQHYAIAFDTIWLSNIYLPAFRLASVISRKSSRFILDIDEHTERIIAKSNNSKADYELKGFNLAKIIARDISGRTVADMYLQKCFGGIIASHAGRQSTPGGKKSIKETRDICFIGSSRSHKMILAIARAVNHIGAIIKCMSHDNGAFSLRFHVLSDFYPPEFVEELTREGVIVHNLVPLLNMNAELANMDVVITGFPIPSQIGMEQPDKIKCRSQISQALAAGLPVLIPDGPDIEDVRNINGVYVFTEETLLDQLGKALQNKKPIMLPPELTVDEAFKAFKEAQKLAKPVPALKTLLQESISKNKQITSPDLLLIWKQHDAGIYGRRIDQIARSYKRRYPDHRVIILEFYGEEPNEIPYADFCGEDCLKNAYLEQKRQGIIVDDVLIRTIEYSGFNLKDKFFAFLCENNLFPENTLCVLFPIIQDWRYISNLLRPYAYVVDIVDNQLSWAVDDQRRCYVLEQYFSMIRSCQAVICNTGKIASFFKDRGILPLGKKFEIIPNWYNLPKSIILEPRSFSDGKKHIFYSGNMNDRIDWQILNSIAANSGIYLHIVGAAQNVERELKQLLENTNVIYHGVLEENKTLELLTQMDAAIIPHILNEISYFMDPIKVQMYSSLNMPIFCPEALSLNGKNIILFKNAADCIQKINNLTHVDLDLKDKNKFNPNENKYLRLLLEIRNKMSDVNKKEQAKCIKMDCI